MDDDLTFEAAYTALHETVDRLQAGGLTLAETVDLYERGTRLADLCARRLEAAELRVIQIADEGLGDRRSGTEDEPILPDP